jgi:3-deoxy-D-manno-octulosonic-acid transferase
MEGRRNIFSKIKAALNDNRAPIIWMHCSSVGEFEQGKPIIERIRAQGTRYKIILTFFSPSGYEANKNYKGADFIFYLPMDSKKNAKKFLDIVQPSLVLWIKYEYWFYYLNEIRTRNINCLLISAVFRKDHSFFKWYGSLQRKMLSCFTHLFVQNDESRELLKTIGIENCTVNGDTRFDRVIEIAERFEEIPFIQKSIEGRRCIIAGSTWKEDEEILKSVWDKIKDRSLKLIIAPHEIHENRLKEVSAIFSEAIYFPGLAPGKWEKTSAEVIVINSIGLLSRLYNYADITYVGGGFTKDGVHNVLEAAVYGKPVIFGPNYKKYREAVELIDNGGGESFSTPIHLKNIFTSLLYKNDEYLRRSKASKNYVRKNKGATEKILQFIQEKRLLTS